MKKHIGLIVLATLVVVVFVAYTITYSVGVTDLTYVTWFGGRTAQGQVHHGNRPEQTGLKFKWLFPIQEVTHYDGRIFLFEDPASQLKTMDGRSIVMTMFCAWQIVDPVAFGSDIETVANAESMIRTALIDKKRRVVGSHNMSEFVNTDPGAMMLAEIEAEILTALQAEIHGPQPGQHQYGIEIVMVGIKSLGLPESTTETVIEAMKAQQQITVKDLRDTGASDADTIRARANDASERILAFAERKAAEIRAEGHREVGVIYAQFDDEYTDFAMFLRSLESLRTELAANTVFLLDGSQIPAVRYFFEGPFVPTDDENE